MVRKPRRHRDPVTPELRAQVLAADRYRCACREVRLWSPDLFTDPCAGKLELDHIDGSGLGRRGPSTLSNLVTLSSSCHRWKTEHAKAARPALRAYVNRRDRLG